MTGDPKPHIIRLEDPLNKQKLPAKHKLCRQLIIR